MISLRLKGPALRAFHVIPEAERNTCERALEALQNRFSPVERQSVHRAALRARRRKPDEDLSELADYILLLVGRAYPGMAADALDSLALEAFLDAIDPSLRMRVRDNEPGTLNNALSRALVLDAYDEADRRLNLSAEADGDSVLCRACWRKVLSVARSFELSWKRQELRLNQGSSVRWAGVYIFADGQVTKKPVSEVLADNSGNALSSF